MDCLEDKGLAAGTDRGYVDLFNTSALELHGPTDPYKSLDASGPVFALAVLKDTSRANREQFDSNTIAQIINMVNTRTTSTQIKSNIFRSMNTQIKSNILSTYNIQQYAIQDLDAKVTQLKLS